jgi:phosphate/sulfate permease
MEDEGQMGTKKKSTSTTRSGGAIFLIVVGKAIAFAIYIATAFGAYWYSQAMNTPHAMNIALFFIFVGAAYKIFGIDIS